MLCDIVLKKPNGNMRSVPCLVHSIFPFDGIAFEWVRPFFAIRGTNDVPLRAPMPLL